MATEQRILKQDGYLDVGDDCTRNGSGAPAATAAAEMRNIIYHPQLNVILVFDTNSQIKILDVNSGVILQTYQLGLNAGNFLNARYMPLQDKILFWDNRNLGFRGDYNGVLLLDTILQTPIMQNDDYIKLEMLLSEAVIFHNCITDLESEGLECPCDVSNELLQKISQAQANAKKGIKAQRWNTICLEVPYSSLKLVANNVVIMLKRLERHIPVLAIASAINERLTDLLVGSRIPDFTWNFSNYQRVLMHSEAVRRQTFEKWPHMDYKWALPDQMAQAGFYHQPSASGEDRAMCFTCSVCLVCWEKTDEPWSEHERHSPMCPFVKGEYTQNVPLSVTYATNPATAAPGIGFDVISNSDFSNTLCTSCTQTGDLTIWSIERHLKKMHTLNILSLLKDVFEESFEWARVTAICALPNTRARSKLNSIYASQNGGGTVSGANISDNTNMLNLPQITSTSTLRSGVVGSKIVLGVSVRQSSGEYALRIVVLNIIEVDRAIEGSNSDSIDVGSVASSGQIKKSQSQTGSNNSDNLVMSGTQTNIEKAYDSKDDEKSYSSVYEKYVDGFDSNGFVSDLIDMKKAVNGAAGDSELMYDFDLSTFNQLLEPPDEISVVNSVPSGTVDSMANDIGIIDSEMDKIIEAVEAQTNNNENGNNGNGNNNNGNIVSKVTISEEIDCIVESWITVKRMNALSRDVGISEGCSESGVVNEVIEIAEIIPTNPKCNQLLVKLQKTKAPHAAEASKIIMATVEHEVEEERMDCDDNNAEALAAQILLFDFDNNQISNDYTLALTFSKAKCPKYISILHNYNNISERRNSLHNTSENGGDSGAICAICADGTIEIYSLSDFQLTTTIEEEGEHFVTVAYCRSLDRLCACTRQGALMFYSLNDSDNESGDEMQENEEECSSTLIQNAANASIGEMSVTDGNTASAMIPNIAIQEVPSNTSIEPVSSGVPIEMLPTVNITTLDCEASAGSASSTSTVHTSPSNTSNIINANLLANKQSELSLDDLRTFYTLTQFDEKLTTYSAEVPNCWNDLGQAQKQRKQSQNLRLGDEAQCVKTWRLHNDATTWDEHIIELNLAQPVSLGHIDLKFTVYQQCPNPAAIQVTLLKQNTSGFGYRMKGPHSSFKTTLVDDNIDLSYIANENPVLSEEYLQAHNAEVLAGPIELSSCIDLCDQGGTATLTSPKLFKTRTRNFLLHIKTVSDPVKDGQSKTRVPERKGLALPRPHRLDSILHKIESNLTATSGTNTNTSFTLNYPNLIPVGKKRTKSHMGCDWLHEISISVRGVKSQNIIPNGRAQRIAMLESNILLENLLKIVSSPESATLAKNMALDILVWICFIRLNRFRSPKSERIKDQINKTTAASINDLLAQQFECISVAERYIEQMIRNCILHSDRSMAHKCVKLLLILTVGTSSLPAELQVQCTLDDTIKCAIANTFNEFPLSKSGGVVRWYSMLVCATSTVESHDNISEYCIKLLADISKELANRSDPYCALLGTRFGLYGFPFEPEIFDFDFPNINRSGLNNPAALTNVIRSSAVIAPVTGLDIKRLSSVDGVDFRTFPHLIRGKSVSNQLRGLLEVVQLHFTCVNTSEATRLDNMDNVAINGTSNILIDDLMMMHPNSVELPKEKDDDMMNDIVSGMQNIVDQMKTKDGVTVKLCTETTNGFKPNGLPKSIEKQMDMDEKAITKEFTLLNDLINKISEPVKNNETENIVEEIENNTTVRQKAVIDSKEKENEQKKRFNEAMDSVNNATATAFPWHKLLSPPPKQIIVIDRMHSGARRHVVLDFGTPILLTDLVIPACDDLTSLYIDIWCFEEDTDGMRLVVASDIGNKTLVLSDIQPAPICRYMKITIIGRIGMSSTKCKIPLGSFFGHPIVLEHDGYGDPIMRCIQHPPQNIQIQIKSLNSLYEDLHCRYSLASCKLMELLTPILHCELTNVAHMQAFINKQRDEESSGVDGNKIVSIYEECMMLQYQINVVRNVIFRLECSLQPTLRTPSMPVIKALQLASRDKLRVLSLSLVEILLHFSIEYGIKNILPVHQLFTVEVANMLFDSLVVYGDAHIQLATCSLLVRMCCFQPWWGDFLADIFCNLFSSQNCKVFPQDRIFFLLTYLGRRSIAMGTCRSIVIDAVLKTLVKNLAPISTRYQCNIDNMSRSGNGGDVNSVFGTSSDLQLITWLLMFLSVCLDDSNDRKDKSATRWDFMSCESDFTKSRPSGTQSGKQLRCLKKRIIQQNKYSMQPYTDWGKKIYMLQNEHPGIFMEISAKPKPVSTKTSNKPSGSAQKISKDVPQETENNFDKGLKTLRLNHILIVIRSLIALLLEMDFTCNMDQFLLTCKVIARLVAACRPTVQLWKVITTAQLEQLIRLAVWNDQQQPWAVHAITCLLQDLLDADKQFKDSDVTPTNDGVRPMDGAQEVKDFISEYTTYIAQSIPSMQTTSNSELYQDAVKYNYLPSLIECEDTDFDDILNDIDMIERTKPQTKKESNALSKNTFNFFCKSISVAMDARLDIGLEFNIETQLRRLTNTSSLDLYSSLPQILTNEFVSTPPDSTVWPEYITQVWTGPEYNSGLNTFKMFKTVFDCVFGDLHFEDTWVHLEQVLHMWLTLNGELSDKSFSTGISQNDVPKIPFGANAVQGLLSALAWHNDIKLRTWCLGFQCLFLACNSQALGDDDSDCTRIDEVIISNENFEKMLLRFFSGYGMSSSIISNRCAGPTICRHLHDLLLWLHKKGESTDGVISCKRKLKDILLHVTLQLVQPGGAISNQLGPIDAQSQLVRDLLMMPNEKSDLNVALHIIESVSFLVYNHISNGDKLQCQRSSENNTTNAFSNLFANVLGSENSKQATTISDNSLIINLLKLSSTLLQTELPRQPSEVPIPEEEELSNQSQTDETKAEQQNTDSQKAKVPCIADTVLRHFPTMKRLLGTLSQCLSCSYSMMNAATFCKVKSNDATLIIEEPETTSDAVFHMLIMLFEKASNPRLIVAPICQYLESSTIQRNMLPRLQLSEPFLWYISKVLEAPGAVQIFTQLGGIKIICQNLVKLNKILLNVQPGLISLIMQHMTKNSKLKLLTSTNGNNNCKTKTATAPTVPPPRNQPDGMINFAPFCSITSENDSAQSADILITNPSAPHRRPRTPAWNYMFYPNESHVDLTITLPTAILLKEVQLQPHAPSLASCPSAVALEISRDYGLSAIPVGPPMTTTGLTCIRLKLAKAEIATSIVLRLYRPKDSSNIGLTQIAILGQTIFSNKTQSMSVQSAQGLPGTTSSDIMHDEDTFAKTSIGWVRILSRCFDAVSLLSNSKLAADVIGASAAYPGFLEACCSLMNIMPMIPNSAQQHLETILLKLGAYNRTLCLQLLRILLWNTTPQVFKLSNEAICDMVYELCISDDNYMMDKLQVLLEWISKLHDNYSKQARCNNPQSGFVKVIASILWYVHSNQQLANLPNLITQELFEICMLWIDTLECEEPLKVAFDSLLCALCYIKPELFNHLLRKVNVKLQETPLNAMQPNALTDDNKEQSGSEWFANVANNLTTLLHCPNYLPTLAMACQSPSAVYQLIDSGLPKLLAHALYEYCHSLLPGEQHKDDMRVQVNPTDVEIVENNTCLTDADKATQSEETSTANIPLLKCVHVPKILDFFSECCTEGPMRDWLGTQQGSIFWKPLLELLCNIRPIEFAGSEPLQRTFIRMERATINYFTRITACHPKNQDTMTTLLISVIRNPTPSTGKLTISGFTRQIVLMLLLENERILVSVRSKQAMMKKDVSPTAINMAAMSNANSNSISMALANHHPSKRINTHHLLFMVSTNTKCQDILQNCVSAYCNFLSTLHTDTTSRSNESGQGGSAINAMSSKNSDSLLDNDKACMHALNFHSLENGMEFLSVAAGVTAKDKRIKDVKNQAAANKDKEIFSYIPKLFSVEEFIKQTSSTNITCHAQLVHPDCSEMVLTSDATISQVLASLHKAGHSLSTPCLSLDLIHVPSAQTDDSNTDTKIIKATCTEPLPSPLQRFSSRGGLSLLALYLPTVYPEVGVRKAPTTSVDKEKSPPLHDWVKLEPNDDIYEDLEDPIMEVTSKHTTFSSVPQHSLAAFGLFLRLPSYSDVLLRDKLRAQCLLRLVLGVTGDGEGNDIYSLSLAPTLPTLPFEVFRQLLDSAPLTTDDGMLLRRVVIDVGAMHLVLNCLGIFTHQSQNYQIASPQNDVPTGGIKSGIDEITVMTSDDKSHMYWAKGTGFGTGSTTQSWNVEQALLRQKSEEEHVTVLLQVLSSYINPGDRIPASMQCNEILAYHEISDASGELPPAFEHLLQESCLIPALSSYLRNDSVLDITRHIPLYRAILQLLRALSLSQQLISLLQPIPCLGEQSIAELLSNMKTCVDTYAKRLKVNKKSNIKGQTQQVTVNIDDGDDEGLALLIPDIQETSLMVQKTSNIDEKNQVQRDADGTPIVNLENAPQNKSIEQRYLDVMKKLQFDTSDMIVESENNGFRFVVSHHFEKMVRLAGDRYHPSRVKRLAQEAVTLSTSLPLSYSSSVFVRCDTDRLDIMKVLITGPADTPYANGCFEFDVFFPPEYPNLPMLINLETTGRHSVRFNPNLYNDGKVCLSVLNTWHGRPEEKWNAQTSSFLQVLVSIQSLILVPEPYFNEPGFERSRGTPSGTHSSREYNSNIYQACVRWAMLEQIRNPSACFKDVIHTHFWLKRNEICAQIENWIDELSKPQFSERNSRTISFNSMVLRRHYRHLREELSKIKVPEGLEDLDTPFSPVVTLAAINDVPTFTSTTKPTTTTAAIKETVTRDDDPVATTTTGLTSNVAIATTSSAEVDPNATFNMDFESCCSTPIDVGFKGFDDEFKAAPLSPATKDSATLIGTMDSEGTEWIVELDADSVEQMALESDNDNEHCTLTHKKSS